MRRTTASDEGSEHILGVRPQTVLMIALVLLGVAAVVKVMLMSERVLVWIFVSMLLALALNPAVDLLQRHGFRRRGSAAGAVFLMVIACIGGIGALIVPTLVQQVADFIDAVPATSAS